MKYERSSVKHCPKGSALTNCGLDKISGPRSRGVSSCSSLGGGAVGRPHLYWWVARISDDIMHDSVSGVI